jgi:hypothetical protein
MTIILSKQSLEGFGINFAKIDLRDYIATTYKNFIILSRLTWIL